MSICGNDFIPIIITIVCCGLLFVYCNSRLAELKNAVEKQNRVLTSFIASIQHDIRSSGGGVGGGVGGGAQKLASDEAIAAVKRFEQDKIVVSDDDTDDDDSDDDDSESDSESDDSLSVSDTESVHGHEQLNLNMEELLFEQIPRDMEHTNVTELGDDVLNIVEVINMDDTNVNESDSSSSSSDESQSSIPVNYDSMKIEELRKIVTDRNLATKEESKKLKKPELLSLLKK